MVSLNGIALEILENKIKKGFPLRNFDYDLKKIREEVEELERALSTNSMKDDIFEEGVDVMIMILGILIQVDRNKNIEHALWDKLKKNSKRQIIKVSEGHYEKIESE
jgi:hypothetical protein